MNSSSLIDCLRYWNVAVYIESRTEDQSSSFILVTPGLTRDDHVTPSLARHSPRRSTSNKSQLHIPTTTEIVWFRSLLACFSASLHTRHYIGILDGGASLLLVVILIFSLLFILLNLFLFFYHTVAIAITILLTR